MMAQVATTKKMEVGVHDGTSFDPRQLTAQEFAILGLEDVAFIKPKRLGEDSVFAICTADGREVAVVDNRDVALHMVRKNDLEPLSVH